MENADAARTIASAFPGFTAKDVELLGEGWDSVAFLVNHEWVFRFPKNKKSSKCLEREICLLPKLAPLFKVAIPHFTFIGKPTETFERYFVGYRKLAGEPLKKEVLQSLPPKTQERVLHQLAEFLKILHAFPIEKARQSGVVEEEWSRHWTKLLEKARKVIFPKLSEIEQTRLTHIFEDYLNDERNFDFSPTLLHADLGSEHILFDAKTNRISAIIDWGDLSIGDPDYEFLYPFDTHGAEAIKRALKLMGHSDPGRALQKCAVLSIFNFVENVLHSPFPQDREWCLAELKKKLASGPD